jgi:uncharacterized peroxidase-related enzyme
MSNFTIHTPETAPEASKQILEQANKNLGFVPGLFGVLAEAPKALEAYQILGSLFKETSLSTTEQHVIWLTINYENDCGYCVPAHTGLAKMDAVADDVIEALRNGVALSDSKFESLRRFTVQLVQKRGWVEEEGVQAFLDAGYTQQNILEIIVGMAHKVISNYTNHIADTPVDEVFRKFTWQKPAATNAA